MDLLIMFSSFCNVAIYMAFVMAPFCFFLWRTYPIAFFLSAAASASGVWCIVPIDGWADGAWLGSYRIYVCAALYMLLYV